VRAVETPTKFFPGSPFDSRGPTARATVASSSSRVPRGRSSSDTLRSARSTRRWGSRRIISTARRRGTRSRASSTAPPSTERSSRGPCGRRRERHGSPALIRTSSYPLHHRRRRSAPLDQP
jgi:hypothetical protein